MVVLQVFLLFLYFVYGALLLVSAPHNILGQSCRGSCDTNRDMLFSFFDNIVQLPPPPHPPAVSQQWMPQPSTLPSSALCDSRMQFARAFSAAAATTEVVGAPRVHPLWNHYPAPLLGNLPPTSALTNLCTCGL